MSTTLGSTEPPQTTAPPPGRDEERDVTVGFAGLLLGIILTSIVLGAVLLTGADPVAPGIFSPERSRTQVPVWMSETPETFSPERSRTQVPSWMEAP
jgi:hypothetical protein